jgi:hypothetical protein
VEYAIKTCIKSIYSSFKAFEKMFYLVNTQDLACVFVQPPFKILVMLYQLPGGQG